MSGLFVWTTDDGRRTTGVNRLLVFVVCGLWFVSGYSQAVNIIPRPSIIEVGKGSFSLKEGINIKALDKSEALRLIQQQLSDRLYNSKEWKFPVATGQAKTVLLSKLPDNNPSANQEAYRLRVTADSMVIEACSYRGIFYGAQSAIQLLTGALPAGELRCMVITDTPQYAYRGLHLDVCRHFFSKEVVKQYLDLMAELKLNEFHWHLTDDQGWRIEIKKYPRLTEVGAWRTEKDGSKYGGYYTQDDIREIVAYARDRYITIVPEIELPGHSSAAIVAYPWLSCNPGTTTAVPNTWGVKKDIYCPSDSTFQFLKDVLDEVCALFPGKLIHLGGDEAPKEAWKKSETAQALMKKQSLSNEEELQHYFLKQMESYLATKGKRVIGWGEIVKGGLSDSVIVMSWLDKNAGKAAAKHGNQVIMTPRFFCYFDYPQTIEDKKSAWWMVYLPLKKVYRFSPQVKSLSAERQRLILGGQANVWTEYIPDEKRLAHQVMPRLAAMAEALWSKHKNFTGFKQRLAADANFFTVKYP